MGLWCLVDIRLDPITHDVVDDDSGDLIMADDAESIAQDVKIRLLTFAKEYFLDDTIGMLDENWLGSKNPKLAALRAQAKSEVEATPGIVSCDNVTFDYVPATRKLKVSFKAQGATDPIDGSVVLIGAAP